MVEQFEIPPDLEEGLLDIESAKLFGGEYAEDPHDLIDKFLNFCDSVRIDGATEDSIKVHLFPFFLKGRAKTWLKSQPRQSITTWEDIEFRFLSKYFPPSKATKTKKEIDSFAQKEGESLYQAWGRLMELCRKCPDHLIEDWQFVRILYNGMCPLSRIKLDLAAGMPLYTKKPEEVLALIERVVYDEYQALEAPPIIEQEVEEKSSILAQEDYIENVTPLLKQLSEDVEGNSYLKDQDVTRATKESETEEESDAEEESKVEEYLEVRKEQEDGTYREETSSPMAITLLHSHDETFELEEYETEKDADYEELEMGSSNEEECKEANLVNSIEACSERSTNTPGPMVDIHVEQVLYDVETNVNQMPMTLLEKMGIRHIRSAKMTLQLPDRFIQVLVNIAENILVKAGNFGYRENFAVIDMDVDPALAHLLKEPLLATTDVVVDELKYEVIHKVDGDQVSILDFIINSSSLTIFPSNVQPQFVEDKGGGRTKLKNPHLLRTKSKPKVKIKKSKKMTMTKEKKPALVLCYKPP